MGEFARGHRGSCPLCDRGCPLCDRRPRCSTPGARRPQPVRHELGEVAVASWAFRSHQSKLQTNPSIVGETRMTSGSGAASPCLRINTKGATSTRRHAQAGSGSDPPVARRVARDPPRALRGARAVDGELLRQEDSGATLYWRTRYGHRRRGTHTVDLTAEGRRLAEAYRRLRSIG